MRLAWAILFTFGIFLAVCAVIFMMGFGASRLPSPIGDPAYFKRRHAGNILFGIGMICIVISTAILSLGVPK